MKPVMLTVDDDPQVLRAVEMNLKYKYWNQSKILKPYSSASALDILKQLKL